MICILFLTRHWLDLSYIGYKPGPSLAPDTECGADHSTHIAWRWSKRRPDPLPLAGGWGGRLWGAQLVEVKCNMNARAERRTYSQNTGLNRTPVLHINPQTGPDQSQKALLTCLSTRPHWERQSKRNRKAPSVPTGQGQNQPVFEWHMWGKQDIFTQCSRHKGRYNGGNNVPVNRSSSWPHPFMTNL